jgi:uncharacterized membrane protein
MRPKTARRPPVRRFWSPRRPIGRLLISVAVGVAAAMLLPGSLGGPLRTVAGWNAGALAQLVLTWRIILMAGPAETKRRAAIQDSGRTVVSVLVLAASTISIFAATVAFRNARAIAPHAAPELALLCLLAVVSAWTLCHTAFTLRYAHLYYRDDGAVGGLGFPGTEAPCDLDFAYYAFTVGMCFQVSDVTVTLHRMRNTTLAHALLSFTFNTAILALALNLFFGQLA